MNQLIRLQLPDVAPGNERVVTVGVPFPCGQHVNCDTFCVTSENGTQVASSFDVTSRWPDGSVRWCMVRFLTVGTAAGYCLQTGMSKQLEQAALVVERVNGLSIQDKEAHYRFDNDSIFPVVRVNNHELLPKGGRLVATDDNGRELVVKFRSPELVYADNLSATVRLEGVAELVDSRLLNFTLQHDIRYSGELTTTCGIHNPQRAVHTDGIWDLGDPGSIALGKLELVLPRLPQQTLELQTETGGKWTPVDAQSGMELYQASSGGAHWQCPTHVNSNNENCIEFSGYKLQMGDQVTTAQRSSPTVICANKFAMTPIEFWQNFPKKMSVHDGTLEIALFPQLQRDHHEIQGGEQKKHRLAFTFSPDNDELKNTPQSVTPASIDHELYSSSQPLGTLIGPADPDYDNLISMSLDPVKGIAAKREHQDEYGWRHYGDVVADHETLYHKEDTYFVSHYNNQYDCIYGFARQYLLSGDCRWYALMDELARHVLDIDIYRTQEDRAEYNHGLFWHTDHYKMASTASHRTYSRDHYPPDWDGPRGGGPGSEHCYTSGLKLYFYITGDKDAKEAIVGLTQWITHYYEGSGTSIEFCKSLLSDDLKKLVGICRGRRIFKYRYGFDRGVGNYIRALLDSYELTSDRDYLQRAEHVIQNTFGAADDITMRGLENVELTWFYSVFLQEIVRFLDVKRVNNEYDSAFMHARDGLLHYANWMVVNEKPYLEQPEILEYPNDTWVAQDIRKANVLYGAYQYALYNRQPLLNQARYFREYVISTLGQSDTLHFSRIQAVLLQNHGPSGAMLHESAPHAGLAELESPPRSDTESLYQVGDFFSALRNGFLAVMRSFSLRREIHWVKSRTAH